MQERVALATIDDVSRSGETGDSRRSLLLRAALTLALGSVALALLGTDSHVVLAAAAACGVASAVLAAAAGAHHFAVAVIVVRPVLDVWAGTPDDPRVGPATYLGVLTILVAATWVVTGRGRWSGASAASKSFVLVSLAAALSSVGAIVPIVSLQNALRVAVGAAFLLFVEQVVSERPRAARTIVLALTISAIVPVAVAMQQVVGQDDALTRVRGTFVTPNTFATFLTIVAPVLLAVRARIPSTAWRVGADVLLVAVCAGVFLSYTRAAWLGLVVGLLAVAAISDRRLLLVIPIVAGIVYLAVPSTGERLSDLQEERVEGRGDPNSWAFRTRFWVGLLALTDESLVVGQGIGMTEEHIALNVLDERERLEPHNVWVQVVVETGIAGVVTFVAFVGATAVALRRSLRAARARSDAFDAALAIGAIGAACALLVQTMSENLLTSGATHIAFAAIAGAAIARGRRRASTPLSTSVTRV
jgi:O-antigen ligase